MADNLKNPIPNFLSSFLANYHSSIPRGAQWVVYFEDITGKILPAIKKAIKREPTSWGDSIITRAETLLADSYQTTNGCLFAQAISLPGESMQANPAGNIVSNAYIRPYVGAGRDPFPIMQMSFLETTTSFADNVLRPWVLATQNFGMIAWPSGDEKNYRTNLCCCKLSPKATTLGSDPASSVPRITMKITFYGICCINVGNEEFNYQPSTTPMLRDAQFVYNSYAIDTTVESDEPLTPNLAQSADGTSAGIAGASVTT